MDTVPARTRLRLCAGAAQCHDESNDMYSITRRLGWSGQLCRRKLALYNMIL